MLSQCVRFGGDRRHSGHVRETSFLTRQGKMLLVISSACLLSNAFQLNKNPAPGRALGDMHIYCPAFQAKGNENTLVEWRLHCEILKSKLLPSYFPLLFFRIPHWLKSSYKTSDLERRSLVYISTNPSCCFQLFSLRQNESKSTSQHWRMHKSSFVSL